MNKLATIEEIIQDAKQGKMFIIIDDEDRENEGDLIIPAQFADAEHINFMAKYGRGLICLALNEARVKELNLPLMSPYNSSRHGTAFTVSIEAKEGVTTGISAFDRAKTIADAIDPVKGAADIASPGHIFPLLARNGGVLTRAGHTEASVDISVLAGLNPAGVICEIMNEDGTMARLPDLYKFAAEHDLKIATIADLIAYRRKRENLVTKILSDKLHNQHGDFDLHIYKSNVEYAEHVAIATEGLDFSKAVNVRMHAQDILSDLLGDQDNNRAGLFTKALEFIAKNSGVIVLLRSPQKHLISQIISDKKADNKPKQGNIIRDYGVGAQILKDLGVKEMNLLTNSPKAVIGIESYGLVIKNYIEL